MGITVTAIQGSSPRKSAPGSNPYNLFGSASGQDEGNPVFRLATRVGTMN